MKILVYNKETLQTIDTYEAETIVVNDNTELESIAIPENIKIGKASKNENNEIIVIEDTEKRNTYLAIAKNKKIVERYALCDSEILAQMFVVFGTSRYESANAYYDTWRLMRELPEQFLCCGFNSTNEVVSFANEKLSAVYAYSAYRINRINQRRLEKEAINALTTIEEVEEYNG